MKKLITLLLLLVSLSSYSQNDSIITYYKEICYNSEWNGKTPPKKFYKDVKIYVGGVMSDSLSLELHKIVKELNDLIIPIKISVVTDKLESNVYLYFGNGKGFVNSLNESDEKKEWRLKTIEHNWGAFWIKRRGSIISSSKIFIDTDRTETLNQQ